ncbi:MAG: HAMP domain-containing histidine kinase, partial [Blautia sp.]|nr:HAMP domain-containing histidine kinase [Blautia sp.]
ILIPFALFTIGLYSMQQSRIEEEEQRQESLLISMPDSNTDIVLDKPGRPRSWIYMSLQEMCLLFALTLLVPASFIGFWLYHSVAAPLEKLKEATGKIRDGNLDFSLEARGEDEMAELLRDFEQMRLRLKQSAEEKLCLDEANVELISNISHDLKTPLTSIEGYAQGILDGVANTPEKKRRYMDTILRKAKEMEKLLNELALYSKIGTGRMSYQFDVYKAAEFFDQRALDAYLELETRGIVMTYDNQVGDDVFIVADEQQLQRVFDNIISNCVKYQDPEKEQSQVELRVRDVGELIQVEVEDNGKGISEENLRSIFDRFYRTDASRNSSTGGSGIGLSIVRRIIEDHGGRAWAGSREGKGTTIYFVLRKAQGTGGEVPHREKATWVQIPVEEKDEEDIDD